MVGARRHRGRQSNHGLVLRRRSCRPGPFGPGYAGKTAQQVGGGSRRRCAGNRLSLPALSQSRPSNSLFARQPSHGKKRRRYFEQREREGGTRRGSIAPAAISMLRLTCRLRRRLPPDMVCRLCYSAAGTHRRCARVGHRRPAQSADSMRLKSSGVILRREFGPHDP
jgi:hypothetical protein